MRRARRLFVEGTGTRLAASVVLGGLCAIIAHLWIVRHRYPDMSIVKATLELQGLLGVTEPEGFGPWEEEWRDPPSARFLKAALAHARPFIRDVTKPYWVWIVPFAGPPSPWHGWPFVSRVPTSTLYVEEEWGDGRVHKIELTPDGGLDPIRYGGLVGNWAFYALALFVTTHFARPLARTVWRRLRSPPPGHCQSCGYNLTGNVSGICPECGVPCQVESGVE